MNSKEILKAEGFVHIYEWHDNPGTKYPAHSHKDKVTIFIEKGWVEFTFLDETKLTVRSGERLDVPVGVEHTAIVGEDGCYYIVGEMIKGDS